MSLNWIPFFGKSGMLRIRFFSSLVGICSPSTIQIRDRVHGLPVDAQFEVKVIGGGVPASSDRADHGPGRHGFAGLYTNRRQMSVQRRDPFPVVEDDGAPVPAHPAPRVLREARRSGADLRPGRRKDVDPRMSAPGPVSETGGNGPGYGRKKPDPVEPIPRDAVPRGGPAPGNQHGEEERADPAAGDQ